MNRLARRRSEQTIPLPVRGGRGVFLETRPLVTRWVDAVLRAEIASQDGMPESIPEFMVAERVTMRLHQGLSDFIGPNGYDVLLARSVALARQAHPFLNGISAGPSGTLLGLDAATRDGAAPREAAFAIVRRFIEQLFLLIGEDIALRLLRGVWPAVGADDVPPLIG